MSERPVRAEALDRLGSLHIRRASTAEQVAEGLRGMILAGELAQGAALREVALAERIGVSRNTMREAIRVLAREGLVMHHMHRGALVTRLTVDDVEDIFRVRRTLELEAVRVAAHAADEVLAELAEAVDRLEAAAEVPDWGSIIDADRLFHERLVGLLGSRRLNRFFDGIQAELRLCMSIVDRRDLERDSLVTEHRQLADLLCGRRTDACLRTMRTQLDRDEQVLREIVASERA